MRIRCIIGLIILLLCTSSLAFGQAPFVLDSEVGVLYDLTTDQVLFSQNGEADHAPASLVKIMTLYLAFEQLQQETIRLDDPVIVSEKAWRMGGSQMFLEVGERVTVEQLLNGIAVVSGNDACVALAEAAAGTEELFVQWMNEKVDALGLNLHFVDVHGLSSDNRVRALDMALLVGHYLSSHPHALEYHQTRSYAYQPRSASEPIVQRNRNGLLGRYEGLDGLKTGFLSDAGYNFVATAEQNDRRLVAVVLGAPSEQARENDAVRLLNYGFRTFEVAAANEVIPEAQARVFQGEDRHVLVQADRAALSIPRGSRDVLQVVIETTPLTAPVEVGDAAGKAVIQHDGRTILEVELLAGANVSRGSWWRVLIDTVHQFVLRLVQR